MRAHVISPRPMPNRAEHAPTRARPHRTAHPRPRTTDLTRPPTEMRLPKARFSCNAYRSPLYCYRSPVECSFACPSSTSRHAQRRWFAAAIQGSRRTCSRRWPPPWTLSDLLADCARDVGDDCRHLRIVWMLQHTPRGLRLHKLLVHGRIDRLLSRCGMLLLRRPERLRLLCFELSQLGRIACSLRLQRLA